MAAELSYKVALDWSGIASEDIPANAAVVIDYSVNPATLSLAGGQGAICDGFTLTSIGSGEQGRVIIDGIVPVKIGTAADVVKGDLLAVDASNGTVSEAATSDVAIAQALNAPAADGDLILARILTNKVTV